jgi:hypothetical protein
MTSVLSFLETLVGIVFCVSLVATPGFIVITVVWQHRMLDHIRKTDPQRFGKPLRWGMRRLAELEASEHDDDPIVDLYLARFHRSQRLTLISMGILLVSLAVLLLTS